MEVQGTIKMIDDVKTYGSNGFRKREVVLTTEEQYPQHLSIEFVQDKCELLDAYKVGQSVRVSINLRGREWVNPQGETKYFNSIQGWRIEAVDAGSGAAPDLPPVPPMESYERTDEKVKDEFDDLPF